MFLFAPHHCQAAKQPREATSLLLEINTSQHKRIVRIISSGGGTIRVSLLSKRHMLDQIQHSTGVPILIVIPPDHLAEVVIQRHASLGIKDNRVRFSDEISRHHRIFSVSKDTCNDSII